MTIKNAIRNCKFKFVTPWLFLRINEQLIVCAASNRGSCYLDR